jgi:hypothetical protein
MDDVYRSSFKLQICISHIGMSCSKTDGSSEPSYVRYSRQIKKFSVIDTAVNMRCKTL